MLLKFNYAFILLLVSLTIRAQDFNLGQVSVEELQEKAHPADTSAPAAILFSRGKTYFEFMDYYWVVTTEIEKRIKIYNKDGYKYARDKVMYKKGYDKSAVYSDIQTYNLVNGNIVKMPLGEEGIFVKDINDYYSEKEIIMPDVRDGSVIEYKYTYKTLYRGELYSWYFEDFIPVNHTSYTVTIPSFFIYNRILTGNLTVKQSEPEIKKDGYNSSTVVYSAHNVKPLRREPYVYNLNNYRSGVKFEMSASADSHGEVTNYTTSWKSMAQMLYKDKNFGGQLGSISYFNGIVKKLTVGNLSPTQKIDSIFSHVQSRMNWNQTDGYVCEYGIREAYKIQTGNVADINLMLVNMLRAAGLSAHPVILSTRANGIADYPSFFAFNYVVAAVQVDNRLVLLDATDKYVCPDILPLRAINRTGRLLKEEGWANEIDLIPKKPSKNKIHVVADVLVDGTISGRVRRQYFDYLAHGFRRAFFSGNDQDYLEALEEANSGLRIENHRISNEKALSNPVGEEYSFIYTGSSEIINTKIYFRPMLFFDDWMNPFRNEVRQYPIDFDFPFEDRYNIMINLPEGYEIEHKPESVSIAYGGGIINFNYSLEEKNNQLQLSVVFQVNFSYVDSNNYDVLKDFFKSVVEKQNEKIVLKKK